MKNRVDNTGLKVFDECPKSMGVKNRENVGGKSFEGETKRDVLVIGKLKPLGAGDSMEKPNEFVGDKVLFKK